MSGLAANPWCPSHHHEWIPLEEDLLPCSWHHLADGGLIEIIPDRYHVQPAMRKIPEMREMAPRVAPDRTASALHVTSPPDGATYLIDPTLRPEFQALAFRASSPRGGSIAWSVDGRALGVAASGQSVSWPLARGRHRVVARDGRGLTAEREITVR
jgi:hypothetical protein